jgi:hypothetical protein
MTTDQWQPPRGRREIIVWWAKALALAGAAWAGAHFLWGWGMFPGS